MQDVKAQIISQVLRQERPFKAQKIHNNLGLGRQLVDYHLKKLLDSGALEKSGLYYSVLDKDALINALGELGENTRLRKPNPNAVMPPSQFSELLQQYDMVVALRTIKHPVANDLRAMMVEKIDKQINELKVRRKYLMAATKSEHRANVILKDKDAVWELLGPGIEQIMGRTEFLEILSETLDE